MNVDEITAYAGGLGMELATWDTDWGMYVRFQIPQAPEDVGRSNPFKRYTKARKDKVGTRFHAIIEYADDIIYDDEVMLKGWGDGINGWKVTLWILGYAEHPFMKYEKGDGFSAVLVELQDDNTPVNQVKKDRLTRAEARKKYPLAMLAGQLCKNPKFGSFLKYKYGVSPMGDVTEDMAAKFIKQKCMIDSRRELDESPVAADIFHSAIRQPFVEYAAST